MSGKKQKDYDIKLVNFRLDVALIERMNKENINKTALVQNLLRDYFDRIDKKALQDADYLRQ